MAEDDSGVKRGGVSGEFKVSSRELQASKAERDCLDNADDTFKEKKQQQKNEKNINTNKTYLSTDLIVVYDRIRTIKPKHINKLTPASVTRRVWECSFLPPSSKKRKLKRKRLSMSWDGMGRRERGGSE